MDVKDDLAAIGVYVEDSAVAGLVDASISRDAGRGAEHVPDEGVVIRPKIVQRGDVLLRNHQHVKGRLGIDVLESAHVIILEYLGGRDFTRHNPAE